MSFLPRIASGRADRWLQYADSGTSAWGRKDCVISPAQLEDYFGGAGIVIPQLPHDDLLPVLEALLGAAQSTPTSFPTAVHLVSCWTCQCQRMFAAMSCSRSSILLNSLAALRTDTFRSLQPASLSKRMLRASWSSGPCVKLHSMEAPTS